MTKPNIPLTHEDRSITTLREVRVKLIHVNKGIIESINTLDEKIKYLDKCKKLPKIKT